MHVNIAPVTRRQDVQWQQPVSRGSDAAGTVATKVAPLHRHCAVSRISALLVILETKSKTTLFNTFSCVMKLLMQVLQRDCL